jgi:hypothetical protein
MMPGSRYARAIMIIVAIAVVAGMLATLTVSAMPAGR